MSLRDAFTASAELAQLRQDRDDYVRRQRLGLIERDNEWLDELDRSIAKCERRAREALSETADG